MSILTFLEYNMPQGSSAVRPTNGLSWDYLPIDRKLTRRQPHSVQ